jgi:hypothetical protein
MVELVLMYINTWYGIQDYVFETLMWFDIVTTSPWDMNCNTSGTGECRWSTYWTHTGQLGCHNCSCGTREVEKLTWYIVKIRTAPAEGPRCTFWRSIAFVLLLNADGCRAHRSSCSVSSGGACLGVKAVGVWSGIFTSPYAFLVYMETTVLYFITARNSHV